VRADHFAEHLQVLRDYGTVSLRSLASTLVSHDAPRETVCITLDDGYADNLYVARPLLERLHMPATVFVVAGQAALGTEFWWDEAGRILLGGTDLPAAPLPLGFDITDDRRNPCTSTSEALFLQVHDRLYEAPAAEREQLLDALRTWAGSAPAVRLSHRVLSHDEIVRIRADGLIEIGAHTMTHPLLDHLPEDMQRAEIVAARQQLEQLLGERVTSFAYPHGRYSARTAALVAEAGFERACTVAAMPAWTQTDAMEIPRFLVRDMDGDAFARRLRDWFGRSPAGPAHG
jgi:peptidoglycan/xylan/chitin deacetylase (PgdA/CDA1 family)